MHIGERETKWLFVILITSRFFVSGMQIFSGVGGSAALISFILCSLAAVVIFSLLPQINGDFYSLKMREPSGTIILFALAFFSLFNAADRLKMFTDAVSDIILLNSSRLYIVMFFASAMLAVCFFGAENITRYSYSAGVVIVLMTAIICIFDLSGVDAYNLCPVMGNGYGAIIKNASAIYLFSDVLYLYLLTDFFRDKKAVRRVGLKAIAISVLIISILILLYCLCVPYPASDAYKYPFFRLTSLANTSVVFQRLDGAVYIIWIFLGFICSGVLSYFTSLLFAKCFNSEDYRGFIPITVLLTVLISFMNTDGRYNILFSSVFLAVILIFASASRKKEEQIEK